MPRELVRRPVRSGATHRPAVVGTCGRSACEHGAAGRTERGGNVGAARASSSRRSLGRSVHLAERPLIFRCHALVAERLKPSATVESWCCTRTPGRRLRHGARGWLRIPEPSRTRSAVLGVRAYAALLTCRTRPARAERIAGTAICVGIERRRVGRVGRLRRVGCILGSRSIHGCQYVRGSVRCQGLARCGRTPGREGQGRTCAPHGPPGAKRTVKERGIPSTTRCYR